MRPGDPIFYEPVKMEPIVHPIEELQLLADLTVRLVTLRQNECKHLAIENIGPEIWHNLLKATYAPPMWMVRDTDNGGAR